MDTFYVTHEQLQKFREEQAKFEEKTNEKIRELQEALSAEDDSQLNESIEDVSEEVNDEVKSVKSQGSLQGLSSGKKIKPLDSDDPLNKSARSKRKFKDDANLPSVEKSKASSPVIGVVTTMQT